MDTLIIPKPETERRIGQAQAVAMRAMTRAWRRDAPRRVRIENGTVKNAYGISLPFVSIQHTGDRP